MSTRRSDRQSFAKSAFFVLSFILLAGCCLLASCSATFEEEDAIQPSNGEEEVVQPATGEETSGQGIEEATPSYDNLTGSYITAPSSGDLESASLTDSEMVLVGELYDMNDRNENGGYDSSMGNKTWVFKVDENTQFGYSADRKFHEQSPEEFEELFESLNFPALNLTIENGTVIQARMFS